jgi:hypothetical protein
MLTMLIVVIVVIVGGVALMFWSMNENYNRRVKQETDVASRCKQENGLDYAVVKAPAYFVGIRSADREIVVSTAEGRHVLPFEKLRGVSLTPIMETVFESTGESHTNRGSQIIGAGLGAAVAGPAGLIVGGLSGSQSTASTSTSSAHVVDLELDLFFRDDNLPRFVFNGGSYGTWGSLSITYGQEQETRNLAARLANVAEANAANA